MVTYLFRVIFESGLEYETTKVELTIKLKCKPLTTPPNTELKEVSKQFTHNTQHTTHNTQHRTQGR